jgi:hypothetical protein
MMRRAIAASLCGACVCGRAARSDAADVPSPENAPGSKAPVHIAATECTVAPLEQVMAVLRVEIGARLAPSFSPRAYEVRIDCERSAVLITASTPAQGTRTGRTDLAGAPPKVRPRIVALAVAEIVGALDREATSLPSVAAAPRPAVSPSPMGEPASDESTRSVRRIPPVSISAFAQTSSFRMDGRWLGGGGVRFEYSAAHFSAGIDTVFLTADQHLAFGSTRSSLVYASPFAAWRSGTRQVAILVGAGYAAGAATLVGRATDPSYGAATLSGGWTAPYAFAALAFAAVGAVRLEGRVQAGWVASPVVGEVAQGGDVRFEGLWAGGQVGVSVGL